MNRLNPSKYSSRYFVLKKLRIANELAIQKYLAKKGKEGIAVDFGCGNKPYQEIYQPFLSKYIGVDVRENASADLTMEMGGKLPLTDNYADLVLSTQVLEHVENVPKYLSEAHRVLNAEGLLFLSTHGYWMYHPDPQDYWRWTIDGLVKVIEQEGFEVVEHLGIMGLAASGLQLFQDGVQHRCPGIFRRFFYRIISLLQSFVDNKSMNKKDASVFFIIAKKRKNGISG